MDRRPQPIRFSAARYSRADVGECAADLANDGPRELGSAYEPFVACASDADPCGEVIGCAAGALSGGDEDVRGFGKGLGRMLKH